MTFRLQLKNYHFNEIILEETHPGPREAADQRLSEIWDELAAHRPDRGLKAKLWEKGTRAALTVIS